MRLILHGRTGVRFMFGTWLKQWQNDFCEFTQIHKLTNSQSRKPLILQGFTEEKTSL